MSTSSDKAFASRLISGRREVMQDPRLVVEKIGPLLTPERREKIEKVLEARMFRSAVLLENIYDRGNISAVMRSAEAFGFYQFHILNTTEEFKVSGRVTQGAERWLEIQDWSDRRVCLSQLKKTHFLAVTRLGAKNSIQDLPTDKRLLIAFGNEKEGVSEELLREADCEFEIPMYGFTQSFNISVAAALCFQKLRGYFSPDASDLAEKERLRALYYWRSYEHSDRVFSSK